MLTTSTHYFRITLTEFSFNRGGGRSLWGRKLIFKYLADKNRH
jgi:hypothetical protein